jgi:membrane associated rhomboid family serine protease
MNYGQRGGVQLPRLTATNKWIIIISASLFILKSIAALIFKINITALLGLSLVGMSSGLIFQVVTYPFLGSGIFEVVFSSLLVWFLGSELEMLWGKKQYIKLLLVSVIGAGLLYLALIFLFFPTAVGVPLSGLNGISNVLILAYALIYPDREFLFAFIFPLKAKYFCMILAGMELMMGLFSSMGMISLGHLSAFFVAYLFMRFADLSTINLPFGKVSLLSKKKKGKGKLTLVKDDEQQKDSPDKDNPRYWQ